MGSNARTLYYCLLHLVVVVHTTRGQGLLCVVCALPETRRPRL